MHFDCNLNSTMDPNVNLTISVFFSYLRLNGSDDKLPFLSYFFFIFDSLTFAGDVPELHQLKPIFL
jgi:hypothetical protein